jgi:glycosyltransferase involved in cell wall biosynthesis
MVGAAPKVGVVGNMNNNMFALTRHLRDRQIDAQLLYAPLLGHEVYYPQADTFDLADLTFCHEVPWLNDGFYSADPQAIRNDMKGYDVVLATGSEAAALSLAGIPIDIYFAYGDDVVTYSHTPRRVSWGEIAKQEVKLLFKGRHITLRRVRAGTEYQNVRRAICAARHVICDWTNDWWDERMLALPFAGSVHRMPWPLLYPAPYRSGACADVHWRSAMDQLRSEHELIVLYHGRHQWTRPSPRHSKNTQNLIRGFAMFHRDNPDVNACLATIAYGDDVAASKNLIAELGVGDQVIWFPSMYRKDVMHLVDQADLCCGEFNQSWLTGGTILEALSLGKPLIHYRDDSLYPGVPLYPLLNAREPAEIAAAISSYVADPKLCRERGSAGAAWFDEYVMRRPLDVICQLVGVGDVRGRRVEAQPTSIDVK